MPISLDGLQGGGGLTPPARGARLPAPYNDMKFRDRDRDADVEMRDGFTDGLLPATAPGNDGHAAFGTVWADGPLVLDRAGHIRRLKQEQSSLWPQNTNPQRALEVRRPIVSNMPFGRPLGVFAECEAEEETPFDRVKRDDPELAIRQTQAGLEIERPRSALHSGDFTEQQSMKTGRDCAQSPELALDIGHDTRPSPWNYTSSPRQFTDFPRDTPYSSSPYSTPYSSRAPSLSSSYSTSFVLKPPTSPLVQSESNEDLDFSTRDPIDVGYGFPSSSRRYTVDVSRSLQSTPVLPTTPSHSRPLPHLRRDASFPYQAHQPFRSFTSLHNFHHGSLSHTPGGICSRRPSISDSSPLHHASMVGSYEESILRGRMSTTPSKPLDFVAQIGVLGLGDCKPSLRCPAHVVVPFPAVFYSYGTTSHSRSGKSEDGPSPYVGQIDLENGLAKPEQKEASRRHARSVASQSTEDVDSAQTHTFPRSKKVHKFKRPGVLPPLRERAPPGGSYRIPERGQIQIIIKNPNKTAVKLFLIPYDLASMEPGTKTFIRQRSYSAGPIIDMGVSVPATPERPILRYLIHLHICSPSRGRFFLYKSIRVVFANRVPDGKEKLRNEVQHPEPRFSAYKPMRESPAATSLAGATLAAENAFRRRSSGFSLSSTSVSTSRDKGFGTDERGYGVRSTTPVDPVPFDLFRRWPTSSNLDAHGGQPDSTLHKGHAEMEDSSWKEAYDKLEMGQTGYGGSFSSRRAEEGLLARRLRGLDVGNLAEDGA